MGPRPGDRVNGNSEISLSSSDRYREAMSLHQQGRLREAEQLYRAFLRVNASDFDCLHNLGLLQAQEGRFDDALGLLRAAVRQDPHSVDAYYNLSNVLAVLGHHDEAVASYRSTLALQPDHAEAHNNLGYALTMQGKTDEALAHYAQALALKPDYAEAHVNLGSILREQGRLDEAVSHYTRALAINPNIPEAHYQLGNALRKRGRAGEAMACYERAIALKPDHAEAHANLGTMLLDQRRLAAAKACFERALAIEPGAPEAWLGLGHVFQQAKQFDAALAAYDKAPDLAEAWLGRGLALQRLKRSEQAIVAYRQALAKGGNAEVALYNLASLGAEAAPLATPTQIVTKAYDQHAVHYDQDHLGALNYQTPDLLFDAMMRFVPSRNLDILDLGCGTGLLGARFHPLARTLIGVDISSGMLDIARQRQIYRNLVCGELIDFLQTQTEKFDLAVAADVFVYFGDLSPVFRGVHGALKDGGFFGFSVEASEGQDFVLRANLRYAHSLAYLRKLSEAHGFVLEMIETKVTRQEAGVDVVGTLAILRRS
jgi:predicted TPR repeat methyltransferase